MRGSVECPNCTKHKACERCRFLIRNMNRWHKVALAEHMKHCTQRHNHDFAIEVEYLKMQGDG